MCPMWTKLIRGGLTSFLTLLVLHAALASAQNQGQYRSRILLDPLDNMGRGTEIPTAELEAQIDSIEAPYARASAHRFLARHAAGEGNTAAAIAFYLEALSDEGLSEVANREMRRELARLYLLDENHAEAARVLQRVLNTSLQAEPTDFLLLAQAHYRRGDYIAMISALDGLSERGLPLNSSQLRQVLALYYRVGAYSQCEGVLRKLLEREPENPDNWHQLAHIFLKQNDTKSALDQLALAMQKKVPFTSQQRSLLIDLQAANGNPHGAATMLAEAINSGILPGDEINQRKLFEFWLQAKEHQQARIALQAAAESSGDTELYLYLAQLQMDEELWPAMTATVLAACSQRLRDLYVSRANLLLGVGLYKQGKLREARAAFINATLVGGAQAEAAEWLQFIGAEPATDRELLQVRGPCFGTKGKNSDLGTVSAETIEQNATQPDSVANASPSAVGESALDINTAAQRRYFMLPVKQQSIAELMPELGSIGTRMHLNLVKAGGTADGPLTIIASPSGEMAVALPIRGTPQASGRYRVITVEPFKHAAFELPGVRALPGAVGNFHNQLRTAGYQPTGETRVEVQHGDPARAVLQLGIE